MSDACTRVVPGPVRLPALAVFETWRFRPLEIRQIEGRKVDGVLLLNVASIEALVRAAPSWTPRTQSVKAGVAAP